MRTSSLDSRSAGPFRAGSNQQQMTAAGSDGFGKYTQSSDFNVPSPYSKVSGANSSGAPSVMTTTNGS